jgi:hypothetical protein
LDQNRSGRSDKDKIPSSALSFSQSPVTEHPDRGNLFAFFQRVKCLKYRVFVFPFHRRGVTRSFLYANCVFGKIFGLESSMRR